MGQAKFLQRRRQILDVYATIAVPVEFFENLFQPFLVGLGQLVQIVHRRKALTVVGIVAVAVSAVVQVQIHHRMDEQ